MADLTGLGIDENVKEDNGGFTLYEEGWYKQCLVKTEVIPTKAGDGKRFMLALQFLEGAYASDVYTKEGLNIINNSKKAQEIGQGQLKKLCKLTGVPFPPPNTTHMHGKPFMVKYAKKSFLSNKRNADGEFPTLFSNEIKGFKACPEVAEQKEKKALDAVAQIPGKYEDIRDEVEPEEHIQEDPEWG